MFMKCGRCNLNVAMSLITPESLKLAVIAALLLSAGSRSAPAQTTWGGLRFGMSVEEAKRVLAGHVLAEERPLLNPAVLILKLKPVIVGSVESEPRVIFDRTSGHLTTVVLNFGIQSQGCFDKPDPGLYAKITMAVKSVGETFPYEYGKPVQEKGSWPSEDTVTSHLVTRKVGEAFKCERFWTTGGQTIRTWLSIVCDTLFMTVSYEPGNRVSTAQVPVWVPKE